MNAPAINVLTCAILLACGLPFTAPRADEGEGSRYRTLDSMSALDERNSNLPSREGAFGARLGGLDAAEGEVIELAVMRETAPADGRSTVDLRIRLLDRDGQPIRRSVRLTLETDRGRYLSPDEQGGHDPVKFLEDRDRREPGLVLAVEDGETTAQLLAPYLPGEARLRVSSGAVQVETSVAFLPDMRPMLVVGVLDGLLRFRSTSSDSGSPARLDDGLEDELGEIGVNVAGNRDSALLGRGAVFAKGEIGAGFLLTLAYD